MFAVRSIYIRCDLPYSYLQLTGMHAHGKHLLSSRLYCRYRNPYDTIIHSSIQVTDSALCHQTTVCAQCSRTIPPVGNLTPPRRTYRALTIVQFSIKIKRIYTNPIILKIISRTIPTHPPNAAIGLTYFRYCGRSTLNTS